MAQLLGTPGCRPGYGFRWELFFGNAPPNWVIQGHLQKTDAIPDPAHPPPRGVPQVKKRPLLTHTSLQTAYRIRQPPGTGTGTASRGSGAERPGSGAGRAGAGGSDTHGGRPRGRRPAGGPGHPPPRRRGQAAGPPGDRGKRRRVRRRGLPEPRPGQPPGLRGAMGTGAG